MLRIVADWNTMMIDKKLRIWINLIVNEELVGVLQPGMKVILVDPPEQVNAVLEADVDANGEMRWYGVPDWSTRYPPWD